MNRTARRLAVAIAYAATNTFVTPLAHAQSTAETGVAASTSNGSGMSSGGDGGFSGLMDNYVWGRNVIALDWFYIRPMGSATPPTTATSAPGLGTYQSPGTDVKVSNANTLSFTFTYFFNDNIAGTSVGGVPPKFNLYGSSNVIAPAPAVGPLTLVNLGLSQNDPVVTVRGWNPAIVAQYYFGTEEGKLRPFVGVGVSYNFFTNLKLNQNFVNGLQNLGQVLQLGMGQVPTGPAKVTAETSNSWTLVANVGVSYESAKSWTTIGTVSYLSLKTTSTITIRSQQGQVLVANKTDIKVDPVVFGLTVGYKF